jgi:hypothetical protein
MSQIEDDLNVAAYLECTGGNTPADYIIIRLASEVRRLRAEVESRDRRSSNMPPSPYSQPEINYPSTLSDIIDALF